MTPSDLNWCLSFLEKHGKQRFGANFHIYPEDHPTIHKLLIYFLRHEKDANRLDINLDKGIFLAGPVGCGKSSLMELMTYIPGPERNFVLRSCRDISFEFMEEGYTVIQRYSKMSFSHSKPRIYCFDELGAERNLKYFGNECNVLGEILLSRYDLYVGQGMLTHITTNLNTDDMEAAYGDRIRSRMRQQFNLFTFSPDTRDKRQ
jgi:hypothetical protein